MWPNPQETADLVTFTEEILNGKLHFLCSFLGSFASWWQVLHYGGTFSMSHVLGKSKVDGTERLFYLYQ